MTADGIRHKAQAAVEKHPFEQCSGRTSFSRKRESRRTCAVETWFSAFAGMTESLILKRHSTKDRIMAGRTRNSKLGNSKPPTHRTPRVPKLGTKPSKSKSSSKLGAKPKPSARAARSSKVREGEPASRLIDQRIRDLGGWRGKTLARMRALILEADPAMTEEWKWNNPVWSHHGIVCTGEAYTKAVKLTFARGASLPDPSRLFNSSLEGNTRRAIDIHEDQRVDSRAFKLLVRAAVTANGLSVKKR
jgi:hypothetical protein